MVNSNSTDDYRYFGSISINDNEADIPLSTTFFIIKDSINEFFPKVTFYINDEYGTLNEYLAFVNGSKIALSFGKTKESQVRNTYRVYTNGQPTQNSQNGIQGKLAIELIHDYYFYQDKISKYYDNNISDIIYNLVKLYNFTSIDIDTTYNSGIWYQPYMSNSEFILKNLLPYAYSIDANNSPFYCWIDNANNFHFKSYKQLSEQNYVRDYKYSSLGDFSSLDDNSILTVNFLQKSMNKIKPLINRVYGYYDENGEYQKEQNLLITNFPKNKTTKIPLIADSSYVTDTFLNLDDDIQYDDTENNRKGYINNKTREFFLFDKILITTQLDPTLHSGQLVNVTLPLNKDNNSLRESGNYIIETCYHKWDGKQGITMLVCGRNRIKLNGDYKFKNYIL